MSELVTDQSNPLMLKNSIKSLFVGRNDELRAIGKLLDDLHQYPQKQRAIWFYHGVGGVGKSWLLHQAKFRLEEIANSQKQPYGRATCIVHYEVKDVNSRNAKEEQGQEIVKDLVQAVVKSIQQNPRLTFAKNVKDVKTAADINSVLTSIEALLRDRMVLVLLIDTAESRFRDYQEFLEKNLLERLVKTNHVGVVFAGRLAPKQWSRFEVRRRTRDPRETLLRTFNRKEFDQQILSWEEYYDFHIENNSHFVDILYRASGGSPRFLEELRHALDVSLTVKNITSEVLVKALEKYQSFLLKSLRDYDVNAEAFVKSLIPLRFYRIEAVRTIREKHRQEPPMADITYRQTLQDLANDTEIIRWSNSHQAYTTSRIVRSVLDTLILLQPSEVDEYRKNHEFALDFYSQLIKIYRGLTAQYLLEQWYHRLCLLLADSKKNTSNEEIYQELWKELEKVSWLSEDDRDALERGLAQDEDLRNLLPFSVWRDLRVRLNPLANIQEEETSTPAVKSKDHLHSKPISQPSTHLIPHSAPIDSPEKPKSDPETILLSSEKEVSTMIHRIGLVGRDTTQALIIEKIDSDQTELIYIEGDGGIGKTRLLEFTRNVVEKKAAQKQALRCSGIIDFNQTQSFESVRHQIVGELGRENSYFRDYTEAYEKSNQTTSPEDGESVRKELDRLFRQGYRSLSKDYRVVLLFDTAENLQHEEDPVQQYCEATEFGALLKQQIIDLLKFEEDKAQKDGIPNTLLVFAARKISHLVFALQKSFYDVFQREAILENLQPLTIEEMREYIDKLDEEIEICQGINEKDCANAIIKIAKGFPIRLNILASIYALSFSNPKPILDIWDEVQGFNGESQKIERQKVHRLLKGKLENILQENGLKAIFDQLKYLRKGADLDILAAQPNVTIEEIEKQLVAIQEIAVVKILKFNSWDGTEIKRYFLHDEIYEIYDSIDKDPYEATQSDRQEIIKNILIYYRGLLNKNVESTEVFVKNQYIAEQLYYELMADPEAGYSFYRQKSAEAVSNFDLDLDMLLRNEVLRFINRYVRDEDYNSGRFPSAYVRERLKIDEIDRGCAVRWVERYTAIGEYEKAIEIARKFYERTDNPNFTWSKVNDPFYKAGLLRAWGYALSFTSGEYQRLAEKYLSDSIKILEEQIKPKLGLPISEPAYSNDKESPFIETANDNSQPHQLWWYYWNLGLAQNALGFLYSNMGRYGAAIRYLNGASTNFERAGIENQQANALNNLAFIEGQLGLTYEAEDHVKKARLIRERLNLEHALILSYNTVAYIHAWSENLKSAEQEANLALKKARILNEEQRVGNPYALRLLQLALLANGFVKRKLGDSWKLDRGAYPAHQAQSFFEDGVRMLKEAGKLTLFRDEPIRKWEVYSELGSLYCDWAWWHAHYERNNDLAIEKLNEAIEQENNAVKFAKANDLGPNYLDSLEDEAQNYGDLYFLEAGHLDNVETLYSYIVKAYECLSQIESYILEVNPKFLLQAGVGFGEEVISDQQETVSEVPAEKGHIYYRTLGKVELWRGVFTLRLVQEYRRKNPDPKRGEKMIILINNSLKKANKPTLPGSVNELVADAIKRLAYAYLYFWEFSHNDTYNLQKVMKYIRFFTRELGLSYKYIIARVHEVEEFYGYRENPYQSPLHSLKMNIETQLGLTQ